MKLKITANMAWKRKKRTNLYLKLSSIINLICLVDLSAKLWVASLTRVRGIHKSYQNFIKVIGLKSKLQIKSNLSFIPYFHLLVFDILVILVAWFSFWFFFCLAHLALQNVNKNYVIFSYFHNFVAKSDQKPKTKNGMNET